MPFKSLAQERYFNANRGKLEKQGVNVDEWNQASKGLKLPTRAKPAKGNLTLEQAQKIRAKATRKLGH